jgi:hypothetical protein
MKTLTADINLDEEVAHLAAYLSLKWTPVKDLTAIISEIRETAFDIGKSWFTKHDLWEAAHDLRDGRKALLSAQPEIGDQIGAEYYDALCTLLDSIMSSSTDLYDAGIALAGCWDYSARVKRLHLALVARHPELEATRPHGWDALAENYHDYDGQEEYDPEDDMASFHATSTNRHRNWEFVETVALPYVLHDERDRRRTASQTLVGAVLTHFLRIAEFLNTEKLTRDLKTALPKLGEPAILWTRDVQTDNPFLKAAFELAPPVKSEKSYLESRAAQAAFAALTPKEQAQRKAKNSASIVRMLERLTKVDEPDPDFERKREEEKRLTLETLRKAFA